MLIETYFDVYTLIWNSQNVRFKINWNHTYITVLNYIISPHTHAHTGGRIKTNTSRIRKDENINLAILGAHLLRVFKQ